MKIGKLVAHIPARGGSKRVPSKNLRYLAGQPMLSYAVNCALQTPQLESVYVNTDSDDIASLALELGSQVYRRPSKLGSDETSGEEFTFDIIDRLNPDTLLMVSPVCPLLEPSDITAAISAYEASDADTLISCSTTQLQTFCEGRPVNIDPNGPLAPSQLNPPIVICNWAITIWNATLFKTLFQENGSGYFGQDRLFWPIDAIKAIKVSTESDFRFADQMLQMRHARGLQFSEPRYWEPSQRRA